MLLVLHALVMIAGLAACALLNRLRTPERLWVHWVGLAWLSVFCGHLWAFSRGTLATMGGKRE